MFSRAEHDFGCLGSVDLMNMQNQIRSEEEFQAKKEQLRQHARTKLDEVFEKKGKHLIVDSDEDDFSIWCVAAALCAIDAHPWICCR